jgi:c-di-GMP-binding flagellar brake protein YcgR
MKNENKRKNARYSCAVMVDGKPGTEFDSSLTTDISKGGLGFVSSSSVPLNKQIVVELELKPEEDPVLVVAQVRWVRPLNDPGSAVKRYRVGMSFEDVLSGSKSRLERYFRK